MNAVANARRHILGVLEGIPPDAEANHSRGTMELSRLAACFSAASGFRF